MIKQLKILQNYDVVPQAIFWRPLKYFTDTIFDGRDSLDEFIGASFCIGNSVNFDLRTYKGHPRFTVTLYLPFVLEENVVGATIDIIVREMAIPSRAIAWRRGMEFSYGHLVRNKDDVFREIEAKILVLKIVAQSPGRQAATKNIKEKIPEYYELAPVDKQPFPSRGVEPRWRQITGNVISHGSGTNGIFGQGLAERVSGGVKLTEKGADYLRSIGFSGSSM
jgi:hypothetical protein